MYNGSYPYPAVPYYYYPTLGPNVTFPNNYSANSMHWQQQRQYQYPEVDIQQFEESAHKFQQLIRQASLLVNKMADSHEFARELMSAAQMSDENKVMQLIKSTGITIDVKASFTPTGIRIQLSNAKFDGDCCKLSIALRW